MKKILITFFAAITLSGAYVKIKTFNMDDQDMKDLKISTSTISEDLKKKIIELPEVKDALQVFENSKDGQLVVKNMIFSIAAAVESSKNKENVSKETNFVSVISECSAKLFLSEPKVNKALAATVKLLDTEVKEFKLNQLSDLSLHLFSKDQCLYLFKENV